MTIARAAITAVPDDERPVLQPPESSAAVFGTTHAPVSQTAPGAQSVVAAQFVAHTPLLQR